MTAAVICMRGLPGSGKSTRAHKMLQTSGGGAVRISRDDLRRDLFGGEGVLQHDQETLISRVQRGMADSALQSGFDVIVDDMNVRNRYVREWDKFAQERGAQFTTVTLNTDVDECVLRDLERKMKGGRYVGEEIIRSIANKYLTKGAVRPYAPYVPEAVSQPEPYLNPKTLPWVVIVDIDGTMALMGDRSPYDWQAVSQDKPNWPVVNLVKRLIYRGDPIVFLSGRDGSCREETERWLHQYLPVGYSNRWSLFMREAGDMRKDSVVKREIFDREIRDKYHVEFVLDDRNQVVQMWRALGLSVFQVADGDF